ncbi:MAG TPA: hypothetical protein VKG82_02905 [Solirubrobacteraceae bacterium]|nr:hypothetical protein [Solirubrobacteraceae bacterium]
MSAPSPQKPTPETKPAGKRGTRDLARTGGMLALAVIATLFAVLNLEEVKVDWIFGSGHAPLILVIVISVLAGIVLTYMAERISRRRG